MFRWRDCCEGHMILGLILTLISAVLLLLVSLSTPLIRQISLLNTSIADFGAFGYCYASSGGGSRECTPQTLGYDYEDYLIGWLIRTAILFPIASGLMFLAFLALVLGLCRVGKFMWDPKYFRTFSIFGTITALLAEIFALVLWVTARNRFRDAGIEASYGPALWLGLAGAITALIATCIGGPAFKGNYMYKDDRTIAYNL